MQKTRQLLQYGKQCQILMHVSRQHTKNLRSDVRPQKALHQSATDSKSHASCQDVFHVESFARKAVGAVWGKADLQDEGLYIMPLGRHVCYVSHHKASQLDERCKGSVSNHHYICPHLQQRERLPVRLVTDASALASEENRNLWSHGALCDSRACERAECCVYWGQAMTDSEELSQHMVARPTVADQMGPLYCTQHGRV